MMPLDEYRRIARLSVNEFQRFCDQVGERAARAEMDEATLDRLLDDSKDPEATWPGQRTP